MKKLLAFLILLMVGVALFAMPVVGVADTKANTVETVQSVGVFATVTDVSPVIVVQAENFSGYTNKFQITAVNDELYISKQVNDSLYRREAYPLSGYSKAAIKDSGGKETIMCFIYK